MLYPRLTREALREGAGLPLGGNEETGGYKGFGLALMVEVDKTIAKIMWPSRKARNGSRAKSARVVNDRQSARVGQVNDLKQKIPKRCYTRPCRTDWLTGTG